MVQLGQIQSTFSGEAAPGEKSAPQGTLFAEHTELDDASPPTPARAKLDALRRRSTELKRGQQQMGI